jgi:hypothetical protein
VPYSRQLLLKRGYNKAAQQLALLFKEGWEVKSKKYQIANILNITLILTNSKTASYRILTTFDAFKILITPNFEQTKKGKFNLFKPFINVFKKSYSKTSDIILSGNILSLLYSFIIVNFYL